MMDYKGYEIPETIEEITNSIPKESGLMMPTIMYTIDGLSLNTGIDIETISTANTEEARKSILKAYTEKVKEFIDQFGEESEE